ncbi:MAG: ribosome silencing factor [Erysipelothrix sp.]|nr:ribosome silencing factor [Erysipelothrix sp.]
MKNNLVNQVVELIEDKFAKRINVIDFERTNPFTDYFVVCDVDSNRQIDAIVNEVIKQSKEGKIDFRAIDGKSDSGWVVIDLYDVVLHVFDKNIREVYELDKLFMNHPQTLKADVQ